jgi:hypothetical protein
MSICKIDIAYNPVGENGRPEFTWTCASCGAGGKDVWVPANCPDWDEKPDNTLALAVQQEIDRLKVQVRQTNDAIGLLELAIKDSMK